MIIPKTLRDAHVSQLNDLGFSVSNGLPIKNWDKININYERVAKRLLAIKIVFAYVCMPKELIPTDKIQQSINSNRIGKFFTSSEREMLKMNRDESNKVNIDMVGWKLENMVGLSWIFGFERLNELGLNMCSGENVKQLIFQETPKIDSEINSWITNTKTRPIEQVIAAEDFYYCWHNAARNIAFSGAKNPTELPPQILVGLIQERRISLTFTLSDNEWDETDLST
jgi:hypothetical protein